jgi:hypothetical protein
MAKQSRRHSYRKTSDIPIKNVIEIASSDHEEELEKTPLETLLNKGGSEGTTNRTIDDDNIGSFSDLIIRNPRNNEKSVKGVNRVIKLNQHLLLLIAESLFTVLPIIILTVVFLYKNQAHTILTSPEWSVTAAIVFGQIIINLISAILEDNIPTNWRIIIFMLSILITLLLIPSVIFLTLVYISETITRGLIFFQILLFLISISLYIFLGTKMEKIKENFTTPIQD